MRHRKKTVTLSRSLGQRKALIRTMAISLITHGSIQTTPAKAKAVRRFVEPMITRGKTKSVHNIRILEKKLGNKQAALQLVNEIGPKNAKRPGGYTRMVKVAPRQGDNAKQVILSLVEA